MRKLIVVCLLVISCAKEDFIEEKRCHNRSCQEEGQKSLAKGLSEELTEKGPTEPGAGPYGRGALKENCCKIHQGRWSLIFADAFVEC